MTDMNSMREQRIVAQVKLVVEKSPQVLSGTEVAFLVGVPEHAIRSAEKRGTIPKAKTDYDGIRCYTLEDAELIYVLHPSSYYQEGRSFATRLRQILGDHPEIAEAESLTAKTVDLDGWPIRVYSLPEEKTSA